MARAGSGRGSSAADRCGRRGGRWAEAARSVAGFGAATSTTAGAVAVLLAVRSGPAAGWTGYVSEAGAAGDATPLYRAGVLGVAAGLLLLAAALPRAARVAATLLLIGAAGTVGSAVVPCTPGCPLPPFEAAGPADLVHGGVSIGAVAAGVFAMLALRWSAEVSRPVRRLAAGAAGLALPLSATIGLGLLLVGRGLLVGVVERLLLGVGVLWAAACGLWLGIEPLIRWTAPPGAGSSDPRSPDPPPRASASRPPRAPGSRPPAARAGAEPTTGRTAPVSRL